MASNRPWEPGTKAQKRARRINWAIYMVKGMQTITRHYLKGLVSVSALEIALIRVIRDLKEANHD